MLKHFVSPIVKFALEDLGKTGLNVLLFKIFLSDTDGN